MMSILDGKIYHRSSDKLIRVNDDVGDEREESLSGL